MNLDRSEKKNGEDRSAKTRPSGDDTGPIGAGGGSIGEDEADLGMIRVRSVPEEVDGSTGD